MNRSWIKRLFARVWVRLEDDAPERDMDEEMRFHLEMATRRNAERGMAPDEARRTALAAFGGVAQQRETALDAVPGHWLDELRQDLKYAARTLRRNPGFATSVVLTLALGIGANTAIFSVVNGVLIRPLPVRDPARLTFVGWDFGKGGPTSLSPYKIDYLRRHSRAFAGLTTYKNVEHNLGGPDGRGVLGLRIAPDFFEVIGDSPVLGRRFTEEEEKPGGPAVVVLSDALWRNEFRADRGVIGKQIRLDDSTYTVVGVTSPAFHVPGNSASEVAFLVPLRLEIDVREKGHNYVALARLDSTRSRGQVLADLESVSRAFAAEHPEIAANGTAEQYRLAEFDEVYIGPQLRQTLLVLLGAVTCVLLIAAANAANLLLARAATREREITVRAALGAKRSRIVRQLLSEGMLLSVVSGLVGVALGTWGVRVMLALSPKQLPRADEIGLDYRVLAFSAAVVLLTGLVFGLAAVIPAGRLRLSSVLGERARGASASQRSRDVLVMSETAFAIVLLAGAGLLLSSFARLRRVDPGFTAENVTAVRFGRMPEGYDNAEAIWRFEQQLIDRLSEVPGVQSVAGLPNFPLERGWNMSVARAGVAESGDGDVEYRSITPGYFETLRIPLLQGRAFTATDSRSAPRVAIINASLAKRFFPDGDALGNAVEIGRYKTQWFSEEYKGPVEIVGIAADVREVGLDRKPKRTVYVPAAQGLNALASRPPLLVIRTVRGTVLRQAVMNAVRSADPRVAAPELQPMPAIVGASIAEQRFETLLLTLFAGTALALTAIGIFGVVSYGVQQRVREIGVRVALGASSSQVLRLIVGRSLRFSMGGAAIGVAGALGLTRFLSSILYDVKATDPLTFSLAVATLLGVAFLASYLPARRATRIDPVRALRLE
jgi:putative ABC transport system permease protein